MKKKIQKLYDCIFDTAFRGRLKKQPRLVVWPVGQDFGYFDVDPDRVEVVVLPHLAASNVWGEIADTLTHELVHAYQEQLGVLHETNEKKMHNKFFKSEFKRAMKTLNEEWNETYN